MRLLRIDEAQLRPDDTVFKEPTDFPLLLTGGILALGLLFAYLTIAKREWAFLFPALILLGAGVAMVNIVRPALKPTNWVLAIGADRVLVKFRPYSHTRFSDADPQVVEVPMSEIGSIARRTIAVTDRGHKGILHTVREPVLDFRLPGASLGVLKERLRHERTHPGVWATHHPVSVVAGEVIRVSWKGNAAWLRPKTEEAVRLLGQHVAVDPETYVEIDLTRPESIAPVDREWYLRGLVAAGTNVKTVILTEKLYGVSNEEAKRMIASWEAS